LYTVARAQRRQPQQKLNSAAAARRQPDQQSPRDRHLDGSSPAHRHALHQPNPNAAHRRDRTSSLCPDHGAPRLMTLAHSHLFPVPDFRHSPTRDSRLAPQNRSSQSCTRRNKHRGDQPAWPRTSATMSIHVYSSFPSTAAGDKPIHRFTQLQPAASFPKIPRAPPKTRANKSTDRKNRPALPTISKRIDRPSGSPGRSSPNTAETRIKCPVN